METREHTDSDEMEARLRAAEHLARGQHAAVSHTLELLAREFDPDKLPKHVITTILAEMGARSVTIWERRSDELELIGIVEGGQFKRRMETGLFFGALPIFEDVPPLWSEALVAGMHFVVANICNDPVRIVLGDGRTAQWPTAELPRKFADWRKHFLAGDIGELLVAPMMMAGELAGMIGVRFSGTRRFGDEEIELTRSLAHQAMLVLQLMRLSRESRETAVLAERNRMARDIHDTLAQGFTGVIMQLEAAKGAATQGDLAEATMRIDRASELARSSLAEARRSVRALRPRTLERGRLSAALSSLLASVSDGSRLETELHIEGDEAAIPADHEEALLRVAQEALTNAVRHADAQSFSVTLHIASTGIHLRLVDNGCGFDPVASHEGFGLVGMKERVEGLGGTFAIRAMAGVGTEIVVDLKPSPKMERQ